MPDIKVSYHNSKTRRITTQAAKSTIWTSFEDKNFNVDWFYHNHLEFLEHVKEVLATAIEAHELRGYPTHRALREAEEDFADYVAWIEAETNNHKDEA